MAVGVDELDPLLQSLQALKPPGASKGKITAITSLCVDNIKVCFQSNCAFFSDWMLTWSQSDSIITQKLFAHFKRTTATHKLGVLFVVDSVTRQWIDKARHTGQELSGSSAPDGTFASGVYRMTELMPALIDDLLRVAPQEQKVCSVVASQICVAPWTCRSLVTTFWSHGSISASRSPIHLEPLRDQ